MSQAELLAPSPVVPSFPPLSYQGVPVLTTEMLAQAYEVEPYQIRQNFRNNRERFVEGKHFFHLSGNDLKEFKNCVENFYSVQLGKRAPSLTLWTERGAARNAKMLDSDRAWDMFELLEETFFRVVRPDPIPVPDDFPGTLSITPSSVADRKPLRALVGSWAKLANAPFDACWNQLKAAFQLANIKELPQEWIPDALAWVQAKIDALPKALPPQPERLPLYRNGAFYLPPANNPAHKPGPQEEALMALWKEWGSRTRELEQLFNSLSRDLDACRGKTFAYAISDLGRHANTAFGTDAILEGLYASQDTACDLFRQALHSMSRQLLLSLNVAVAMGR